MNTHVATTVTLEEAWNDLQATPSYLERYQREKQEREANASMEEADRRAMLHACFDVSGASLNIW